MRFSLSIVLSCGAIAAAAASAAEHPPLVDVAATECVICHEGLVEGRASVHWPAADDCTTCHEVAIRDEVTTVELMDSDPALCLFCHDGFEAAVDADLEVPHFPVTDSCLTCHDPHGSDHPPVLVAAAQQLCGECHDSADLAPSHGGQLTPAVDCASCHQPHGSNVGGMLVAPNLHAPFSTGSCDGCHREPLGDRIRLRARGSRLCTACHTDLESAAGDHGSVHAALASEGGAAGCLSCHDPHLSAETSLLVAAGPALCAECHAAVVEASGAATGHAPASDDCTICHLPHSSEQAHLLVEPSASLCSGCHDLEPRPARSSAAVEEIAGAGRASYGPAPVVAAADFDNGSPDPEQCAEPFASGTWSGEIVVCERGRALRVDKSRNLAAGGAGGMILVNRPDGAENLAADAHAVPAVHITAADGERLRAWLGAAGEHRAWISRGRLVLEVPVPAEPAAGDLVAVHLGADLTRLDCVGCHSPHGAGNPSLLARYLHAPVEDGCDLCHEGGHDELTEDGGSELCLLCHDDIAEQAAEAAVPHAAFELGSCIDCHNPHASAQEKLVNAPGAGPCADCHDEQLATEGEVAHGIIELVGCRACHAPHGGDGEKLLTAAGAELCLGCHDRSAVHFEADTARLVDRFVIPRERAEAAVTLRLSTDGAVGHPVANHPVAGAFKPSSDRRRGSSFEGVLECLTCHDPHKGPSSKLLRWGATSASQSCGSCHQK